MKIQFFARLRELLGSNALDIPDEDCPESVGELRTLLREHAPAALSDALADPNVVCAVNQVVADAATPIDAKAEIAFFPPVTGG